MVTGQEKICNNILKYSLDTFPRTLMLLGAYGSGKHLIINEIASHLNMNVRDLTEEISFEVIEEIYRRTDPTIYIINIDNLSIKEQNMILKFVEEPLKNSFIILLTESGSNVLATIFNRCQIWRLAAYSKDYLKTFTDNENILRLASTPGQVQDFLNADFEAVFELADKIVTKIGAANLPNVLTISSKLTTKDEKGKIPAKLLISALVASFRDAVLTTSSKQLIDGYKLTAKLAIDSKIRNVDLKYLIDSYLIQLRDSMRTE